MDKRQEDVYVVGIDSAGFIKAVNIMSPEYADSTAMQLRHYPHVRKLNREQFLEMIDKEGFSRNG